MIRFKNSKYSTATKITILFLELYILVFLVAGAQFNIISKTLIGALFLIHLEVISGVFFLNQRLIVIYISMVINCLVLSLYVLIAAHDIPLMISFFLLASLLLTFNRPFLFMLSKMSELIKIVNIKIWPNEKPFKILTAFGAFLSFFLITCILFTWSYNINQDYPENYLEQICIHEAGHAVIAEILFPGKVTEVVWNPKVTYEFLKSIGFKNFTPGYTRHSIERDFLTPKTTKDNVKILLAGELATKHFYGENHLLGGGSDIPNAHDIVKRYFKLTYTDELGTIDRYDYDPKVLNDAAKQFVDSQVPKTEQLVAENSQLIKLVATELKEKRRMSGDELRKNIKHR